MTRYQAKVARQLIQAYWKLTPEQVGDVAAVAFHLYVAKLKEEARHAD